MTDEQLIDLASELFFNNTTEQIEPEDLRYFLEVLIASREAKGVAASLVTALLAGVGSDGNTLKKLNDKITALASQIQGLPSGALLPDFADAVHTADDAIAAPPAGKYKVLEYLPTADLAIYGLPDPSGSKKEYLIKNLSDSFQLTISQVRGGTYLLPPGSTVRLHDNGPNDYRDITS